MIIPIKLLKEIFNRKKLSEFPDLEELQQIKEAIQILEKYMLNNTTKAINKKPPYFGTLNAMNENVKICVKCSVAYSGKYCWSCNI